MLAKATVASKVRSSGMKWREITNKLELLPRKDRQGNYRIVAVCRYAGKIAVRLRCLGRRSENIFPHYAEDLLETNEIDSQMMHLLQRIAGPKPKRR